MSALTIHAAEQLLRDAQALVEDPVVIGAPMARQITGACVDSRRARAGDLFVALPGERTDGHKFVDNASQGGAIAALVDYERLPELRNRVFGSIVLLPVRGPLDAFHVLAKAWRREHDDLVRIGITGSNGKTTTKELLNSILSQVAVTIHSRGNYNSEIGLPMEILRIRDEHQFGVFEMGMNQPGEIRKLAALVEPGIAIITNIGTAHIGMIGSQEGIAREKRDIFHEFRGEESALIPRDSPYAAFLSETVRGTVLLYDLQSAGITDVRPRGIAGTLLHCREGAIELRIPGAQMVANASAALSVARLLEIDFSAIKAGIEAVEPVSGRAQVVRGPVTIIQDCYNANPESMESALQLLSETEAKGRRVAVLGAMKELGDFSSEAHRDAARSASQRAIDEVILVGDEFAEAVGGDLPPRTAMYRYDEWDQAVQRVLRVRPGDVVLLKGSRSVALERLVPMLANAEVAS